MEHINNQDSLDEYKKKMAHNRRVVLQAKASIQRAKDAGIPNKYMRIPPKVFMSLLDPHYHKSPKETTEFIYKKPLELLKKEFIVIDGGSLIERQKAAYAIMFRLIACNKRGICVQNSQVSHQLQTLKSLGNLSRNDVTEEMRSTDILFLSEIISKDFANGFDTGRFYDEFLGYRDDHVKPTILSFYRSLVSSVAKEDADTSVADVERFGQYISLAAQSDQRKDNRFFRVRVKS